MKLFNLARDSRGNYRRDLGWERNGERYQQHRFYLGRDRAEATRRVLQLERLWALVESRWVAKKGTERPEWDGVSLAIGLALARGEQEAEIPVPQEIAELTDRPGGALLWLREWETAYPLIRLKLPEKYATNLDTDREMVERVSALEAKVYGRPSKNTEHLLAKPTQSLHAALDEYGAHLRQKYTKDGALTEYGVWTLQRLDTLKAHVEDRPLVQLDATALDFWQRYWEQRPKGKRGTMAPRTCINVLKIQRGFVRWLDKQAKYEWRIPATYERRKVKLDITQEERAAKVGQTVKVFSVEQLATLYEYALPWERAVILLGLNAGFSRAEVATLQRAEIRLGVEHPHYHKVGNWIMRLRKKTDVYGEWRLWPETVEAIKYLERIRPRSARPELLLNKNGETLWAPTAKGNPNRQLPNMWMRLVARVRKDHPEFPPLAFKYVRKTASSLVRRIAGGEVAALFLSHGRASGDDLLEVYAQRPFAKVHRALKKLRRKLAPMFAKVPVPFLEGKATHPQLSLGTIRRIKEMRAQGFKVNHICKELGVSPATVYRLTKV